MKSLVIFAVLIVATYSLAQAKKTQPCASGCPGCAACARQAAPVPVTPIEKANLEYKQCKQQCRLDRDRTNRKMTVEELRTELAEAEQILESFARENVPHPPHADKPHSVDKKVIPEIKPAPEVEHQPLHFTV